MDENIAPQEKICYNNEDNDGKWWWVILFFGLLLVIVVLVVIFFTKKSPQEKPKVFKSAEYPSLAENESCESNVVEISLTASDNEVQILTGNTTKLYNYNNSFPGPLIEAKKGDVLIVHFFNDISEPTKVTWHGISSDCMIDSSSHDNNCVMPGKSFTYKFKLNHAGLFWYHSDVNPVEQVHKGLYGVILVRDYNEDEKYCLPHTEKILAFSDIKLNNKNQVEMYCDDEDECERLQNSVNGVIGNLVLTNGVYQGAINIYKNEPTRLRMVNCAVDRFMKIFIEGHDMLRIGGDQGLIERPILIKSEIGLLLTPGERADIVFVPRKDNIRMFTQSNPRGSQILVRDKFGNCKISSNSMGASLEDQEKLLLVTFIAQDINGKSECGTKLEIPLELKKIKRIHVDHCTPVIPICYRYPDTCSNQDNCYFSLYKNIPGENLTSKEAPIVVEDGIYIIEITNTSSLANNFHLHGFSFQHLDTIYIDEINNYIERVPNLVLENKDTIYIPPSYLCENKVVVRLAVDFRSRYDIKGKWIFQSHILSNAQAGQQGFVQIIAECDRSKYSSYSGYSNTYSSYSDFTSSSSSSGSRSYQYTNYSDHSFCLTRPNTSNSNTSNSNTSNSNTSNSNTSNSNTSNSDNVYSKYREKTYNTELEKSLDYITKSLITCKCGSGLAATVCCKRNKNKKYNKNNFSGGYSSSSSLNSGYSTDVSE